MLFGELFSIYSENNSERINIGCDKRQFVNLTADATSCYHWALNGESFGNLLFFTSQICLIKCCNTTRENAVFEQVSDSLMYCACSCVDI